MAVEQMNISMSPKMASFIRGKVRAGGYTNASEVVRTALRRMQEAEARQARLARPEAEDILAELSADDLAQIAKRVRTGFAAIERGEYADYIGREGLARLSAEVKARGRKFLAKTQPVPGREIPDLLPEATPGCGDRSCVPRLTKPEKSVAAEKGMSGSFPGHVAPAC